MSRSKRRLRAFKRLKGIVVLSLFDGMSCGQIALNRVGFNIETYFASEVDKYAMQVTQHNYPNTIQIGSVLDITIERLGKFEILLNGKYIIDTRKLILIGGSPCQGFSFAGTMSGSSTECNIDVTTLEQYLDLKSKNFKFKGQSYLFWEYMRVLELAQPMYYFLENVKMVKKWEGMFNDAMGHEPIVINSALVSAQNRVRLYWTNIPDVVQPEDKDLYIRNILEDTGLDITDRMYLKKEFTLAHKKAWSGVRKPTQKAKCLTTGGQNIANSGATNVLIRVGTAINVKDHDLIKRVYGKEGKSPTLNACTGGGREPKVAITRRRYRKLSPLECERLQTVPDNYTSIVSNSQRYKMLGNGWTVDVPAHIFKNLIR